MTHCDDKVYRSGGIHWYPSPEERRTHAIQRVQGGNIQGYVAYLDNEIVGWCNSNTKSNCQEILEYWRFGAGVPIDECPAGEKIKLIFCFVIAPHVQGKGLATQILGHVCKDAADDGFDFVEAFTHSEFTQDGFRGPLALYEKCGFIKHAEKEGKIVVRKSLNYSEINEKRT